MYNPTIGRFIGKDVLRVDSLNRYHYVVNNPINFVDLDGLIKEAVLTLRDPNTGVTVGGYLHDGTYEENHQYNFNELRYYFSALGINFSNSIKKSTRFRDLYELSYNNRGVQGQIYFSHIISSSQFKLFPFGIQTTDYLRSVAIADSYDGSINRAPVCMMSVGTILIST